ncbi:AmpG family muropeptide MFS transporter [Benzoatithermus flavus]|uniref:AmpG family muropeptide MFS transporter n=1 Tax=Benzoatithermus flavus TaxID=3108223 RepID=A0ABU8XT78_9PROT
MESWLGASRVYLEPRVIAVLFLGFASGLPLLLTLSTLTFWLAEAQVDKAQIGLFALAGLPYTWKFLWSPVMDRVRLPVLGSLLGRRRGWLVLVQSLLMLAILGLGACDPQHDLGRMAVFAVLVAFLSASQDIVVDAYRVELLEERQQGAGAAVVVIGYRIAMLVSGAGALVIAEHVGWFWAYAAMAACMAIGMITVLLSPEPRGSDMAATGSRSRLADWMKEAVVEPFADFFRRNGIATALLILLFIMLYKLGDALLGTMTNPFYVELGFTKTEVATIVKGYGLVATLLGGFLGGIVVNRRGVIQGLWICGLIQMLSNLVFVAQAWIGHDLAMLTFTISAENLAGGMGTAAFVAYLGSLCNLSYTATQYALLSSFMAQARTTLAAGSGLLADSTSWVGFFVLTTLAAVPGLLLLLWLQRRLERAPATLGTPAAVARPGRA